MGVVELICINPEGRGSIHLDKRTNEIELAVARLLAIALYKTSLFGLLSVKAQKYAMQTVQSTTLTDPWSREFPGQCAKHFKKPVFCQIGYFVSSTGSVSLETVKRHIQQQDYSRGFETAKESNCN